MKVRSAQELLDAVNSNEKNIEIEGKITGAPSVTLPEGAVLSGGTIEFKAKGIRLTRNNTLNNIKIITLDYEQAVYNDTSINDAGTISLKNVETVGQIYIEAKEKLNKINVEADGVFVREADVRGRAEQPHGFGVDVLQGGFTLWNRQSSSDSVFTAHLSGIKIGTGKKPVRGSGVFVAGYANREPQATGGLLKADLIETSDIFTDGGILSGTPDKISAGVFVSSGAVVKKVENNGPITTYGANDMVLDLWGEASEWEANAKLTSKGDSGIGFVNFGKMGDLSINAPILTKGAGARGFNMYDGEMKSASFESITTTGDGSIGIQVSKPMGKLSVKGDVVTYGGEGTSLVKGVQMTLKAVGVSIKPGADIASLKVNGKVQTNGDNLNSVEVLKGAKVHELHISSIEAKGKDSKRIELTGSVPEGSLI